MRNVCPLILGCWLASFLLACGADTTTGRPVTLQTELVVDPEIAGAFVTNSGWSVQLTKARLSLRALYYFDGDPAFARRTPSRRLQLARLSGLSVARAHPGHYVAGEALGQMTQASVVDLLAGSSALALGQGITGRYKSARVELAAATNGELDGQVARVEGVAVKDQARVHFLLSASLADLARNVKDGRIDGCTFDEAEVESDGTVRLTLHTSVWFKLVDFTGVAPGSVEQPTAITPETPAQIAFAVGLVQLNAYRFSYSP